MDNNEQEILSISDILMGIYIAHRMDKGEHLLKLGEIVFGADNLVKWCKDPDPQVLPNALKNAIDICMDADTGAETYKKRLKELINNGEDFLKDAKSIYDVCQNIASAMGVGVTVVYRCICPPEPEDAELPEWRKELHDYFYSLIDDTTKEDK